MPQISIYDIEGFEALSKKLKSLPDKVKRAEVVKIQRRVLKPAQQAYANQLPVATGNLSASVQIKTVSISKSKGNPSVQVLPGKNKGADGYYRFMVVKKGTKLPGGNRRGSRKGFNNVVRSARDRALRSVSGGITKEYEQKLSRFIQRRIDKL